MKYRDTKKAKPMNNEYLKIIYPWSNPFGWVQLINVSPSVDQEQWIVRCARQSTTKETKGVEQDTRLIKYLYRNRHTSPFEMVEFTFEIKVPIFVARQLVRHRTASLNEYSLRYSESKLEFYLPPLLPNDAVGNDDEQFFCDCCEVNEQAARRYTQALERGVPRERARILLPTTLYTEIVWKQDLHNLLHMLRLRTEPNAQMEIREMANAMLELITPHVPNVVEMWKETK